MSPTIEEQIEGLKRAIAETEAQRVSLGDEFVDSALKPYQRKLNELIARLAAREEPSPAEPAQQRKLVTLLFMDIAGSTSIAQHMDPEDVSAIFDVTLKKLAQPIEQHGGRVTRFMGDGFLSVFGAPTAHEDDPELAVRAGLKIIELSSELAIHLQKEWGFSPFQVRVGINTGLVMLGGETEAEDTLMGAAVNLAARLESAAPPGGLLVTHDTYRHIRGVFDVEALEPISAKGFDEPLPVYRVLRPKPRTFRQHSRGVEGVETRMIGRETELKVLQDALLTAIEEGEGHIVTVFGEAGVGKSRLLYEFQDWIELLPPPAVRFFEGRAHSETQDLPYALLRDLFAFRFQIQDNDSVELVREKLASGLGEVFGSDTDSEMCTHLLGQWLGYDFSASPHLRGILNDAEQLRNRGLMYLGDYFRRLSSHNPVVIFLEDIHWADDSSLDALSWLGERMQRQRLLVVCAARHTLFERRPYWGEGQTHHTRLDLRLLSRRESRQLVGEILRLVAEVPIELRELVVEGAEGNPFYVEELIKMLIEKEVILKGEEAWRIEPAQLSEIQVPPTLAGVLQARLDSLPPNERTVLQQASVVGRLFWDRIVAYIQSASGGGEEIVPQALSTLRGRELIFQRERSAFEDAREYIFKHDILREVTYDSVLKRLRKVYHGLVADWLIAQGAERVGQYNGLIGEHLLLAGRSEQASQYFIQAGEAALASYANGEAEAHFRKALGLLLTDVQKASSLSGLGEALSRQGRREESIQLFRQGIDLYLELGASDAAADLYMRLSVITWRIDYLQAWKVCQEGLARLGADAEGPGMARLLAEAGRTAHFQVRPAEEVSALCRRSIAMAERHGELKAWAEAKITIALSTRDKDKCIRLLQDAAAFSEAHGLGYPTARAKINIGVMFEFMYLNTESTYSYFISAQDILLQLGDIEGMFFNLENLVLNLIHQGHLNSVESALGEYLLNPIVPQSRGEEFREYIRLCLLSPRGEWMQALEYYRQSVAEAWQAGKFQVFERESVDLANACLELNRFVGLADLSEAETALQENDKRREFTVQSRFMAVVILSRQKCFAVAHQRLAELIDTLDQPMSKPNQIFRLTAESELALAEGRWDEAVSIHQSLVDIFQASQFRWKHARQLINLGDALLGRNDPGDRDRAQETFRQALEMFTDMGAPGYVKVLKERLGGI